MPIYFSEDYSNLVVEFGDGDTYISTSDEVPCIFLQRGLRGEIGRHPTPEEAPPADAKAIVLIFKNIESLEVVIKCLEEQRSKFSADNHTNPNPPV